MLRLSDIMSRAGLHGYADVALVLFVLAFLGILVHLYSPARRREMDEMARKPLEDEPTEHTNPGARS